MKVLRVFRLERVIRLLRAYGIKNVGRSLIQDRAGSALLTLLLMGILVLEFGSLEILHIEQDAPGANITTASDALWYTIVTISTVGYGDRYPVTNDGRIVGSFIIIVGVGIFGTFTGYLANLFLSPSKKRSAAPAPDTDNRQDRRRPTPGAHGAATGRDRRDQPAPASGSKLTNAEVAAHATARHRHAPGRPIGLRVRSRA